MEDKYKFLKEYLNALIEREDENLAEAIRVAGSNSPGASMAYGAFSAYMEVLDYIKQLEAPITLQE